MLVERNRARHTAHHCRSRSSVTIARLLAHLRLAPLTSGACASEWWVAWLVRLRSSMGLGTMRHRNCTGYRMLNAVVHRKDEAASALFC